MFSKAEGDTSSTALNVHSPSMKHASEARILLLYNAHSEFFVEVGIFLSEIIPELQTMAVQMGIDLDFSNYLVMGGEPKLSNTLVQRALHYAEDSNTIIVCLVGDLYGEPDLPLTLKKEELEQLRSAVFEQSQDVKLLNEHYQLDRTLQPEGYRLLSKGLSGDNRTTLINMVHVGAKAAFDDGVINQANPERQKNLFYSPLHSLVSGIKALKAPSRTLFILRQFEIHKPPLAECDPKRAKAIADLKNDITSTLPNMTFPLSDEGTAFLASNQVERYKDNFARQLTEKLKELIKPFASTRPATMTYTELHDEENRIHTSFAQEKNEEKWVPSKKVESRLEKILCQPAPGMYLIQGPTECGKTRLLCRVWDEISKKKTNAIRIIRFANLTYSCMYAHEIWYNICVSVCREAGIDPQPLLSLFHLTDLLNVFCNLIEPTKRPIYVFIDDLHSVKMGRLLCPIEKKSRRMPNNMILIGSVLNLASFPQIFVTATTFNLETPSESDIIDILKKRLPSNRKLTSEHSGSIKQQLSTEGRSLTLGQSLVDEICTDTEQIVSGGLIGRLARIEDKHGSDAVSALCRCLLNSRNGLTRCEMMDYLSRNENLLKPLGVLSFPPFLFDDILFSLGSLITSEIIDEKKIYKPSSITFLAVLRMRYSGEKAAVCKALADQLYKDINVNEPSISPRAYNVYNPLQRVLKRDNGTTDLRIIRQLWFYLLHTGDMDSLKEHALCKFDFIDLAIRSCGLGHLFTMYEDTLLQVLHHDVQVLAEQVLLPSIGTIVRDGEQAAAEVIGRLRFTRAENSHFLNSMVEGAMGYVDGYGPNCLLVPLSCWVAPPKMSLVLTFDFKEWKNGRLVLVPTYNHQHILVTGNENALGDIYMVHVASQFVLATYRGHTAAVTSLCESSEGDFFTSTSADKTVRIWYRNTDQPSKVLRPHNAKITCSCLSSDNSFLVTGSADSTAKAINLESGEIIKTFPDHTGSVVSVQLTSNDNFLITGSGDFTVQMWNIRDGVVAQRMGSLMAPVTCIAMTSNDAFVAVACEDETLRVFGTVSGQELHDMNGHEGKINALVAAHDDCQLFAATQSRIFCYDIHTGQIVLIWDTQVKSPVTSLEITRDNFFLISGCGSSVHVWNIRERIHDGLDQSMEAEGHVTSVSLSPDDKLAACGTFAGIVALWDLDIAQCVCTIVHTKRVEITTLSFSLDSSVLLSGNSSGNIILIETIHGRLLRSVNIHNAEIKQACWMIGKRVVSVDKGGFVRVWDAFEEEEENEIPRIDGVVAPLQVATTTTLNTVFVSHITGNQKELRIWCIENNGLLIKSKLSHNDSVTAFSVAPQGSLLVSASADESLKIWTIESGYLTQVLVGHEGCVTCCAIAGDERIVVSGGADKKVILWSVSTGDTVYSLSAKAAVTAVAITSDGSVAFSADEEGWLEAWSVDKGILLSSFNSHRPIISLLSSSDATRLILKLPGCAQLPILCLHNTPAGHGLKSQRKRSVRNTSITSLSSNISEKKDSTSGLPLDSNGTSMKVGPSKPSAPRPTFDKLERSKSRLSIGVEKEKSSVHGGMSISGTGGNSGAPITRSKACIIL